MDPLQLTGSSYVQDCLIQGFVHQLHSFLVWETLLIVTHVLVTPSPMDYYNELYMGLPLKNIWKLHQWYRQLCVLLN